MNQEIEMNFKVKDKKGLLSYLHQQAKETTSHIKMTYLGLKNDDSFYIRIEEIEDDGGKKKYLTAKGNFRSENGINQRKEISLPISRDIQQYTDFLLLIGMELRDSKGKIRHKFAIGGLDVTLDEWDVEELGDRLEIEGKSEEKIKKFAQSIIEFCKND